MPGLSSFANPNAYSGCIAPSDASFRHSLRSAGTTGRERDEKARLLSGRVGDHTRYGGLSSRFGESVKISAPFSVTPIVCSNCAESERSRVTAVQPSGNTLTGGGPRLIIGSLWEEKHG